MANTFNLGNGNWAQKTEKLLAYNAENDNYKPLPFDFDRASTATRVNRDGLIETVATDEPRIDFLNNTKGHLLLEPSRSNLVTYSEDFSDSSWNLGTNAVLTYETNITAPDGSLGVYRLTLPAQSSTFLQFQTGAGTTNYTGSIYAKSASVNDEGFNLFYGGLASSRFITNNDWLRYDYNNDGTQFTIVNDGDTFVTDIYIWGAQLEEGSYATSYIPTSGSAVTRTEDFCFINSGLQDILNTNEGTLFVEVEVPRVSSTGSFERITLSDQNASTDRILFDNYGGNWRALMLSTAGNVNKTIVSVTANQRIKVAIAYSSTELRISYDGNTATTTSGSYTPTTTLESFKFSNKDGGNKWQGKIHQAMYFDTALTDAELIALTS